MRFQRGVERRECAGEEVPQFRRCVQQIPHEWQFDSIQAVLQHAKPGIQRLGRLTGLQLLIGQMDDSVRKFRSRPDRFTRCELGADQCLMPVSRFRNAIWQRADDDLLRFVPLRPFERQLSGIHGL